MPLYVIERHFAEQLNVTHDSEHYGNLITYLRMKDLVPPSSAQQSSSN